MAVTYVGRSSSVANAAIAISPALFVGLEVDDILLLFCETLGTEAITVANSAGGTWAEVENSPQSFLGGSSVRLTVFWSRYNGTQTAPTTSDSGDHNTGVILGFRGCVATGNPWNITVGSTQAGTTSGSITGGTTTVDGCMIVAAAACGFDVATSNNASNWANASLTNVTERVDQLFAGADGGGLAIATGEQATAGVVNATTWTQANSGPLANLMIALAPVGPPSDAFKGLIIGPPPYVIP